MVVSLLSFQIYPAIANDLETVLDYGQSILNVAQELTKSLIEQRTISTRTIQAQMNRHFQDLA
jgi:regulator of sigma D